MLDRMASRLVRLYGLRGDDPGRSATMEGLRGVAVLLVFCVHYTAIFDDWIGGGATRRVADLMYGVGQAGVDLFFVLSGYLIYGGVIRGGAVRYGAYARRRLRRVYPTFLAVFVLYVVLSRLVAPESKIPAQPAAAVGYLVANLLLLPGMVEIPPLNVVTWSLSFEVFFYLTIPLLVGLLRMRSWRPAARIALVTVLGLAWLGYCLSHVSLRTRLVMFVPGIVAYEALHRQDRRTALGVGVGARVEWAILALTVLGLGIAVVLDPGYGKAPYLPWLGDAANAWHVAVLAVVFGPLVAVALRAHGTGPLGALLTWAPLRAWGNVSYSYYLIHSVAIQFNHLVLGRLVPGRFHTAAGFWLALPVTLVTTWVVGTALYVAIERPVSLTYPPRLPLGLQRFRSGAPECAPPLHVADVEPGSARERGPVPERPNASLPPRHGRGARQRIT